MILEPVLEHPRRRGAAALLASLKSLLQPRPGASGEKETPLQALPHPWHPCCPDLPRYPAGPRSERAREPWSTTRSSLTIQRPSRSVPAVVHHELTGFRRSRLAQRTTAALAAC